MTTEWNLAQAWEREWHGNCINSFHEEEKQLVYAEKMGLVRSPTPKTPVNFDLKGKDVLDIGGGAYSLLLKCVNLGECFVADPLMRDYPEWVIKRYAEAGIHILGKKGEDIDSPFPHEEVWIYNVLEHTIDPKKVIENALRLSKVVRIFEWLETAVNIGHLHSLNEKDLDRWLGGKGKVENINRNGASGKCYYGVFKGEHYATSSNRF